MNNEAVYDMDDAVAALEALHAALTYDLEDVEAKIRALGHSILIRPAPAPDAADIAGCYEARAILHSGLASIAEVLAWIACKTEDDPEGDVAVATQPLPTLRGYSIH
jgi:hypothetical protein